jgi:hypothetical protein
MYATKAYWRSEVSFMPKSKEWVWLGDTASLDNLEREKYLDTPRNLKHNSYVIQTITQPLY